MKVDIEPFVAVVIIIGILGAMFIGQYDWGVYPECPVCPQAEVYFDEIDQQMSASPWF